MNDSIINFLTAALADHDKEELAARIQDLTATAARGKAFIAAHADLDIRERITPDYYEKAFRAFGSKAAYQALRNATPATIADLAAKAQADAAKRRNAKLAAALVKDGVEEIVSVTCVTPGRERSFYHVTCANGAVKGVKIETILACGAQVRLHSRCITHVFDLT